MDLQWSDSERELLEEFRRYLDANAPDEAITGTDNALIPEWSRRWQAQLFDDGWMIPTNSPEFGGCEATVEQSVAILSELASRDLTRSAHFPGYGIVAPSLLQFGTPEQQALAPAAFRGDTVWCIGMSEPDAGSDLASLRTRAEVFDDRFVIHGQKIWTSYAAAAQKCVCYVRTNPDEPRHRGISALIVDMDSPGVDVRPLVNMGGMTEFAEVFFDGVEVPRSALLGELNGGWVVTMGALGHERATMWVEAVARLERVVSDLIRLAQQTGGSGDALVREWLAKAYERVFALRSLGLASLTGDPRRQLVLKLATSELYTELLELGCMIGGSPATTGEVMAGRDWGLDFQRALAGTIAGGTSDIQRDIVAHHALGMPRG